MNSSEAIAMRVTSAANVSVGTSLALETIIPHWPVFDPARVAPPKVSLHSYTRVYFNLMTLLRNIRNAIPREVRADVKAQNLGEGLAEETVNIQCKKMGIMPEEITSGNLSDIAAWVEKVLIIFAGEAIATAVKRDILSLK